MYGRRSSTDIETKRQHGSSSRSFAEKRRSADFFEEFRPAEDEDAVASEPLVPSLIFQDFAFCFSALFDIESIEGLRLLDYLVQKHDQLAHFSFSEQPSFSPTLAPGEAHRHPFVHCE